MPVSSKKFLNVSPLNETPPFAVLSSSNTVLNTLFNLFILYHPLYFYLCALRCAPCVAFVVFVAWFIALCFVAWFVSVYNVTILICQSQQLSFYVCNVCCVAVLDTLNTKALWN